MTRPAPGCSTRPPASWSPEAVAACKAEPSWLPPLFEGPSPVGKVRPAAADEFGLPRALVVAGGGDAAVGALGLGAIAAGEAFISLGTATQLIVTTDRYLRAPDKLVHGFAHALPSRWYAMAAMLNGAGALAFAARLLGETPDALERWAADGYPRPAISCSCLISPASARRSMTLTPVAFSSA